MSVVDATYRLYRIERRKDRVIIFFLTNRLGYLIPIFLALSFCYGVVWTAIHLGRGGGMISALVAGSVSLLALTCFIKAEHLAPFVVTIEPDVVSFQRSFRGVPVSIKKIYPRSVVTDLGVYVGENRSISRALKWGRLCLWAEGKSILLESWFPISEGLSLANDLRKIGVEFPRTYGVYDENCAALVTDDKYLSF
jgi:hypothetical protein